MKTGVLVSALLAVCIILAALPPVAGATPRNLNVRLKPTWNSTSLLVEAGEFFSQQSPNMYWKFVTNIVNTKGDGLHTDKDEYEIIQASIKSIGVGGSTGMVMDYALALRYFSAIAQVYRGLLQDRFILQEVATQLQLCPMYFSASNTVGCADSKTLDKYLPLAGGKADNSEEEHTFDHVYPTSSPDAALFVLYADYSASEFIPVHNRLVALATSGKIRYVLRPLVRPSDQHIHLQGFGVELAIKNMEYKVLDDSKIQADEDSTGSINDILGDSFEEADINGFFFNKLLERRSDLTDKLNTFRDELLSKSGTDGDDIKVWDLIDLGIQACQSILRSKDPLVLMQDISQNFPLYASSLAKVRVNNTYKTAMSNRPNWKVEPGTSIMTINAISIDPQKVDLFELHDVLSREARTADTISGLGLPGRTVRDLLKIPAKKPPKKASSGHLSVSGDQFRVNMATVANDHLISWMNDLEKDSRYNQWPRSVVSELLEPGWPNQLKYVRKNMYTAVAMFDPSKAAGLKLFSQCKFFIKANAPIRIGVVFHAPDSIQTKGSGDATAVWAGVLDKGTYANIISKQTAAPSAGPSRPTKENSEISAAAYITQAFRYIVSKSKKGKGWQFLEKLAELEKDINLDTAEKQFKLLMGKDMKQAEVAEVSEKIRQGQLPELIEFLESSGKYVNAKGFTNAIAQSAFITNGVVTEMPIEKSFKEVLMSHILSEQNNLIAKAKKGEITQSTNFASLFEDSPSSFPAASPHILQTVDKMQLAKSLPATEGLGIFISPDKSKEFLVKVASHWCVVDLATLQGLRMAYAAINHVVTSMSEHNGRVILVQNPKKGSTLPVIAKFMQAVSKLPEDSIRTTAAHGALGLALSFFGDDDLLIEALNLMIKGLKNSQKYPELSNYLNDYSNTLWVPVDAVRSLELGDGVNQLLCNGRFIAVPASSSLSSLSKDYALIEQFEGTYLNGKRVEEVLATVTYVGIDVDDIVSSFVDNVVMRIQLALTVRATTASADSTTLPTLDAENPGVITHTTESSMIEVVALLDPLSKDAQRITPVLIALRDVFNCSLTVILNPQLQTTSYPIKRYYRYAVNPQLSFDSKKGGIKPTAGALFRRMHTTKVLTLTVDTPETWFVSSETASYDLDNLRIADIAVDTLNINFKLKNLLFAGECTDESTQEHPAGLQLDVSTPTKGVVHDTLVMSNLGYFQLQTNPGVFKLTLHGAANTIFEISSAGAKLVGHDEVKSVKIAVTGFNDPPYSLTVARKQGQMSTKLADLTMEEDDSYSAGLFSSFFGRGKKKETVDEEETVHIFSVASGHLYERFLKIMMLSVINSTKSPVKFWFIENFLSPQFKEFAPKMASQYGYEVGFVTYKWPSWLRQQTEKQRVIWGYKILFLDVMFPLSLKRVIYVDADQVVRGDVNELWQMDLNGAPYGYTPFCDSNKDTEGFRFWKQGYWRDHLRGRPYHISALYVIDLRRFRRMRAGDTLRMVYDNLSQDPNSLSNLDQDLPNYAQHMVPIFSLPQEWLWCQTWCSMDTLGKAKTIDLCNNPLTKTPKLQVAKSLLPEWEKFDNEAARVTKAEEEKAEVGEKGHNEL